MEELLPLAAYVQSIYCAFARPQIRWNAGYQSGDAEMLCAERPPERCHLELTLAQFPNQHLVREHRHREGGSFDEAGMSRDPVTGLTVSLPVVHETRIRCTEVADRIEAAIAKKIEKLYPGDTILIVTCRLAGLFVEWDEIVEVVRTRLRGRSLPFLAVKLITGAWGDAVRHLATRHRPDVSLDDDDPSLPEVT